MKMKLDSLSLSGYCSYDSTQTQIDFRQVNIIIGANGAGKSNLVSFLELVAYMMTGGLRRYVARQGGADSLLYFGMKQTESICGQLRFQEEQSRSEDTYSFALEPNAMNQLFYAKEMMTYWEKGEYGTPYRQDFGVGHAESGMTESSVIPVRSFCGILKQLRVFHFNDTSISSRIRRGGLASDDGYLRSDGGNIAAFLYRMKRASYDHYLRIVRYIRAVFPQFDEFFLQEDEGGQISLRWQAKGGEEILGPHQMSDGALRFIALTTLLLQPAGQAPGTIILDEPEIGLHPYAVSVLANEIRLAGKSSQFIIATQSPALLDHFDADDIITAEYDPMHRRSVLRRQSSEELAAWLGEYSLGELWEKNVLGGTPL